MILISLLSWEVVCYGLIEKVLLSKISTKGVFSTWIV
jgi:hypothetical protein